MNNEMKLTCKNLTLTLDEWSKKIGWSVRTINRRLNNDNLTMEQVLSADKIDRLTLGTTKWKNKSATKTYHAWKGMRNRCSSNPLSQNYKNYYGRGIRVCLQWINDFDKFFEDMGEAPDDCSLDRINNEGNYEPKNCRWVNQEVQLNNKRNTIYFEFNGKNLPLAEWSRISGIERSVLWKRIKKGYSGEKVFSKKRINSSK